ncbi:4Fe-4S dicluster domain-containing protein [Breznakiellaceae bacterium SP9]
MAQKSRGRKAPAIIRFLIALAVLALFVYAYFSSSLDSNGILVLLVKGQFSAVLYGVGLGGFVLVILALTLICGRLYCSVLCPLGTVQELFWRAGNLLRRKKRGKQVSSAGRTAESAASTMRGSLPIRKGIVRRGYAAPPVARYVIPLLVAVGVIFSITPLMVIFDPISTFGRGMGALRNLLLSGGATVFMLIIAAPLILILIAALLRGRAFCNWCPVGVTLGLFSSAAPLGMKVSPSCVSCGLCEAKCPAGCIDVSAKRIDSERCVLCFSCTAVCPTGSAAYSVRGKSAVSGEARRVFLKGAGKASLVCGAAYLLGPNLKLLPQPVDTALANLPEGETLPILPPGAKNLIHYTSRCIACHACVASCPAKIITAKDDPHPRLDYNGEATAACQFNCIECGRVCPTKAITPLSVDEKHRTRIALSTLYFERCVVNTKHESCGACAEVCPTGALTMVAYSEPGIPFLTRPIYDERYCIGCGACLAACPAEPRAFTLAAVPEQSLTIGSRPLEEAGDELRVESTDDFPF